MQRSQVLSAAAILILGCSTTSPVAQATPVSAAAQTTTTASERFLAAHNLYRAAAGVPPLQWSAELASGAATYGPQLEALGRLEHSPRHLRRGIAENLWMGTRGFFTPEQMVGSWGEEREQFVAGIFPDVSTTGNWLDVSHYTQMIWRSTTEIGCSIHQGARYEYLVCRYAPAGNRDGQRVP